MMDGFRCKILLLLSLIIIIIIIIVIFLFSRNFLFSSTYFLRLVCCVYPPSVFCLRDEFLLFLLFGNMILTLTNNFL